MFKTVLLSLLLVLSLAEPQGRLSRLRALRKYFNNLVRKQDANDAEDDADQADQNDQKGNTPLTNQNNLIYYGQVTIGTPGQNFNVLFDTAVADLWVPGANCTTAACLATTLYDPASSSTDVGVGTTFTTSNTYGTVSGDVWRTGNAWYGVFGMAFSSAASISGNPVVQTMINNGMSPSTFGIYLNRTPGSTGSQVTFGGYDSSKIASGATINYLTVTSAYYWSVQFNSIRIGSTTLTTGTRAIMDSGVSLIFGPSSAVNTINNIIGATFYGNGLYTVSCSSISTMPMVVIRMGGINFNMPASTYTLNISGICFSGFSPLNVYNNEGLLSWVLGDVFLSTFYSIYDIPNQRVGLARSI